MGELDVGRRALTLRARGVAIPGLTAFSALLLAAVASAQARKAVNSVEDLPRFTYPVPDRVADLLLANPERFEAFARPVVADIERVRRAYDIKDKATTRAMLSAELGAQIASGREDAAALATIASLREQEDKEEARLNGSLVFQSFLEARMAGHDAPGTCPAAFAATYTRHLDVLPWKVVGTQVKMQKGLVQVATPAFISGFVSDLQPTVDRAHSLSSAGAWRLLAARPNVDAILPCRDAIGPVLAAYVTAHDVHKPDIWAARAVVFPDEVGLTPVNVGIWDSGFDRSLFAGRLMTGKDGRPLRGPAFDVYMRPVSYDLPPLTPEEVRAYPAAVADRHGISDLQIGIDSPAAEAFRRKVTAMSPAQAQAFFERSAVLGGYMHGTHVTGIAASGNPAIRLTSAVMTYDNKPVPTPPTDAIQARLEASYRTVVDWLRAHGVRVVNMSFGVRLSDYEALLEKNGIGKDADARKRLARHYLDYDRRGFLAAFRSAPDILFVAAAMNTDSDNAFDETMPSGLDLPNLITVGAVDQAGARTNFTSSGRTVRVYASGYNVDSVVPGGAHVQESGTSMAAPQVTNLAAKLIAIDPTLTPQRTIALIEENSDAGDEPGIRLMNEMRAVAALRGRRGLTK